MTDRPDADDGHFGGRIVAAYDESTDPQFDPQVVGATVDLLQELAGGGRALEFGVGTGRIALPLAERGVPVHGIDLSRAMVEQLRGKPGAESVELTIGDVATTRVDGSFSLVYLVFNTIMNLPRQAEQVACFRNAAAHLEPGGRFVVEVQVPRLRRFPPHDAVPLRLARRARPHGRARRTAAARPLGGLAPRAVHPRERAARLGLGGVIDRASRPPRASAAGGACTVPPCDPPGLRRWPCWPPSP